MRDSGTRVPLASTGIASCAILVLLGALHGWLSALPANWCQQTNFTDWLHSTFGILIGAFLALFFCT